MANKIILKNSSEALKVPQPSDLSLGEVAINTTDAKLYIKNTSNQVVEISGSGGGGGDADTLEGLSSSQFLRSDTDDSMTGNLSVTGQVYTELFKSGGKMFLFDWQNATSPETDDMTIENRRGVGYATALLRFKESDEKWYLEGHENSSTAYQIWHEGNQGTGSGLDADTIHGIDGTAILRNDQNGTLTGNLTVTGTADVTLADGSTATTQSVGDDTTKVATTAYVETAVASAGGGSSPVGSITQHGSITPPSGYLLTDGRQVSQTTYSTLYAVIGDNYSPRRDTMFNCKPYKHQYFSNDVSATDLSWTTSGTSLNIALEQSQAVVTKDRVYLFGGWTTASVAGVRTAAINPDGTLGAWSNDPQSLPNTNSNSQIVTIKNKIYIFGGWGTSSRSAVFYADINAGDGTIGTWTSTTTLPTTIKGSQIVVTENRVYIMGGYSTTALSNIYSIDIDEDGLLGPTWRSVPISLPIACYNSQSAVIGNKLYMFGGTDTNESGKVNVVDINADGSLGTWLRTIDLPIEIAFSQVLVTEKRVYLIGGQNISANELDTVYYADVYPDGTIGAWTLSANTLPSARGRGQVIVTSSRVYYLGGRNSSNNATSTIFEALLSGGKNDYSSDSYLSATPEAGQFYLPNKKFSATDFGNNAVYNMIRY